MVLCDEGDGLKQRTENLKPGGFDQIVVTHFIYSNTLAYYIDDRLDQRCPFRETGTATLGVLCQQPEWRS